MKAAVEHRFTGSTALISAYDSSKTCLGTLMYQYSGAGNEDKYVSTRQIAVTRPFEVAGLALQFPHAITFSDTIDWVFAADASGAAVTRKIAMFEFNKSTWEFNLKGFITMNFVAIAGNKIIRGLRALRTVFTTGTVTVSGTSVTGSGCNWQTNRLASGARIGFGTIDPTAVTTWYEIASIDSENGITLTSNAGSHDAGTAYVIDEIRIAATMTNVTTTNGGLFVVKGLHPDVFTPVGVNIAQAAAADNIRGIYWLADAASVTNIISNGLAIDDTVSTTSHYCYVPNGSTTMQIFKYDLRASLSGLAGGKSTSAFVLKTGVSGTLTGTAGQLNNGRLINVGHGTASGVKSVYFTTTTRVYRCDASLIVDASTTFISDSMAEIPPGSASTFILTSVLSSVDYSDTIDRLIIMTTGAAGVRNYITSYQTSGDQFERMYLIDTKQLDQSLADADSVIHPSINATSIGVWSQGGIWYLLRAGTTAALCQLYATPGGCDWDFTSTTNQMVITPKLYTPNCSRFYRAYYHHLHRAGEEPVSIVCEPVRVYYRTDNDGIDNNTAAWILLDRTGDMSSVIAAEQIQFKIEFRIFGSSSIPGRVYDIGVVYEDNVTDSHYNPSVTKSSASGKIFAWRQGTAWGSNIPEMRIQVFNASTGISVLDDDTSGQASSTFEYSTDGSAWLAWDNTQDHVGYYIRYTASSLPDGVIVRAVLTQQI